MNVKKNQTIKNLLVESIEKYKELKEDSYWSDALLNAPPVLWFGNMNSDKEKIITIAANPSYHEFEDKKKRFFISDNWILYPNYIDKKNVDAENKIYQSFVDSYNNYFKNNPFMRWFWGVEAFLNGLDASLFENRDEYSYQGIHIDLFPFATKKSKKFKKIKDNIMNCCFNPPDCWGQRFLMNLLDLIEPKVIVLFASTNVLFFERAFRRCSHYKLYLKSEEYIYKKYKYRIYQVNSYEIFASMSLYLGNPYTSKETVKKVGKKVSEIIMK